MMRKSHDVFVPPRITKFNHQQKEPIINFYSAKTSEANKSLDLRIDDDQNSIIPAALVK